MAWDQTTTWQAFIHRAISAVGQGDLLVYCLRPRLSSGQTADHKRPRIGSVSVLLLAATSTPARQVVADVWHRNDTCTCLHQQPSWLLQQLAVRCRWRFAEETTSRSECSCSGGDRNKEVRPHHAGASRPALASNPSENQVQAGHDSLQVHTWIGTDILGWRLSDSDNLCYLQQATPAVRCCSTTISITISTKDNDLAGDEECRRRRPSHLEQSISRPANCNSLSSDVRSTSEGPPIWMTDSAPEDYLWGALQIHASSSSSSCTFITSEYYTFVKLFIIRSFTRYLSSFNLARPFGNFYLRLWMAL